MVFYFQKIISSEDYMMNSDHHVLHTCNELHLGDNIFCCIMFSNIKEYIEQNNIFIKHYCQPYYIDQISELKYSNNISIHSIHERPADVSCIHLWIGAAEHTLNWYNRPHDIYKYYDIFLLNFYNQILRTLNVPVQMQNFIFSESDLLLENEQNVNKRTNGVFSNMDFLIVNGSPHSGQIDYNKDEWDGIIRKFSNKYKVVTTQKVDDILCTTDYQLTAKDIASIGKNAKKIIAIDSGVSIGFYNKHVIENVEVVYYLNNLVPENMCSFANFKHKNHIRDLAFYYE